MASITYPVTLPQYPDQTGYTEQRTSGKIMSEMDSGPSYMRAVFTATSTIFDLQLTMTTAQTDTFDTFYYTTCKQGVEAFDWLHPRTGDSAECRFYGEAPPSYMYRGADYFTVSFKLEVLP